jgi:hypothetical protein
MAKYVVIQDRQGDHTANVFLKESFRPVVLLWSYICIYVRLVLTDSNTKGQLQKRVIDAANHIRKNPEMLNSVYENWYRRTQMCLNANGRHTEHLL